MTSFHKTLGFALTAALLLTCFAIGPTAGAQESNQQARKAKILANLKLEYPSLADAEVSLSDITPTEFEGLEQGSFTVAGPQPRTVGFFVSSDDTKFFVVNSLAPLDVSKTTQEIARQLEKQAAEEARAAEGRNRRLASASKGRPFRGNADAPVTVVEFSDFQCPYCARGATTVEELLENYPEEVKFVYMHFPLGFHPWARPAAIAAECAANQNHDYFWTLHDKFFEEQQDITPENVMAKTGRYLEGSGIDMATWLACAKDTDSKEYKAADDQVSRDMALGETMGVTGTPGFLVNGQLLSGAQPLSAFEPIIAAAIADEE